MKDLVAIVRHDIVAFLEQQTELLFNEGDFRLQLGMWLLKSGHDDDVEVEYYIPNNIAKEAGYDWNSNLLSALGACRFNMRGFFYRRWATACPRTACMDPLYGHKQESSWLHSRRGLQRGVV